MSSAPKQLINEVSNLYLAEESGIVTNGVVRESEHEVEVNAFVIVMRREPSGCKLADEA